MDAEGQPPLEPIELSKAQSHAQLGDDALQRGAADEPGSGAGVDPPEPTEAQADKPAEQVPGGDNADQDQIPASEQPAKEEAQPVTEEADKPEATGQPAAEKAVDNEEHKDEPAGPESAPDQENAE